MSDTPSSESQQIEELKKKLAAVELSSKLAQTAINKAWNATLLIGHPDQRMRDAGRGMSFPHSLHVLIFLTSSPALFNSIETDFALASRSDDYDAANREADLIAGMSYEEITKRLGDKMKAIKDSENESDAHKS